MLCSFVRYCFTKRWCFFCSATRKLCDLPLFKCLFLLSAIIMVMTPFIAVKLPMSKLYKKYNKEGDVLQYAKNLNTKRVSRALEYFNGLDSKTSKKFYKQRNQGIPDIVVCVVTVSRTFNAKNTRYLLQTVSVIDKIIKSDVYFPQTLLYVCNVDSNPMSHNDAVKLHDYVPYVQKHGINSWNKSLPFKESPLQHENVKRGQELADYVFCLNTSHSFGSPYVLMLEDDVVPYENVFKVLHYTLKQRKFIHSGHVEQSNTSHGPVFSFLKLYYPERWQGFANEGDRVLELISLGVLGGALGLIVIYLLSCKFKTELSPKLLWFYYACCFIVTLFVVSLIGRQYVMDVRRFAPQLFKLSPTPGCCTPAMFYSSHIIPDLMKYLQTHSNKNKDLAINDFIQQNNIPGFLLEPNLVRHIGMYTSLQNGYKVPYEFVFDLNI